MHSSWKRVAPRWRINTRGPFRWRAIGGPKLLKTVFEIIPRKWRGIGEIPGSGLGLRETFSVFDAEKRFGVADLRVKEDSECLSGLVMQGLEEAE